MAQMGKSLMLLGAVLIVAGLVLTWGPSLPFLGRLPGDIRIERPGGSFYFPVTTCLLVSVVASAILYLISRFR